MLRNVFLKSLRDQEKSLLWWAVGILSYVGLIMAFYPTVQSSAGQLQAYLDIMPEGFKAAFLGEVTDLTSPVGFVSGYVTALIAPILFLIYAIGVGSDAIAGEEDRGTLDLLLANPVGRVKVYLQKFATMTVATTVLAVTYWVVLAASAAVVGMDISQSALVAATVGVILFSVCLGALALAVGAATGSKGTGTGVAFGVVLVSYVLNSFGPMVGWLEPYRKVSLFYLYTGVDPLVHGLVPAHVAVFVALTAVFVAAGAYLFDRRDLAV
jgi:ABC-2 type transport system permease protein